MGAKKLTENTDVMRAALARDVNEGGIGAFKNAVARLNVAGKQMDLEGKVGVLVTKHELEDAIVYVEDCGSSGFRAHKLYSCGLDMRVGSLLESSLWALEQAKTEL